MTYKDELQDAGRWFGDPLETADWIRDEDRDAFPCVTCGSRSPAIIEGLYCSDCTERNALAFQRTRDARIAREQFNEDEPADTNREGQPEFNGAFR